VLQHAPESHLPIRPGDPTPTSRNLNPLMHPFAKARERTRALNAAKMDRMFSKPFVDSLGGHVDGVEVLVRHPGSLTTVASGSWDGGMCVLPASFPFVMLIFLKGLIVHNLSSRQQIVKLPQAHKGKVSGLCFAEGDKLLSCGVDRNIKLWAVGGQATDLVCPIACSSSSDDNLLPAIKRLPWESSLQVRQNSYTGIGYLIISPHFFCSSIDHHRTDPLFATASNTVQVWDETKYIFILLSPFPY